MGTRRRYSEEFKREAVSLAARSDQSGAQVASELGINANTLYNWIKAYKESGDGAYPGSGHSRDEEVTRLKRELLRVKKERDFLREAATFFAKESSTDTK